MTHSLNVLMKAITMAYTLIHIYPSLVTETRGQCGFTIHEISARNHLSRANSEVGSWSHPSPVSHYILDLCILSGLFNLTARLYLW